LLIEEDALIQSHRSLSPSGRYLLRERFVDAPGETRVDSRHEVVDLASGVAQPLPHLLQAVWLAGDSVAAVERGDDGTSRLTRIGLDGASEPVRALPEGRVRLDASPDRRRLMVRIWGTLAPAPPPEALIVLAVYDPETSGWTDLLSLLEAPSGRGLARVSWAGPRHLALSGERIVALAELREQRLRYLVGGPAR
jgi:hypothetical protein